MAAAVPLSRRSALLGVAAVAAVPAAARARAVQPVPVGPLTLAEAEPIDFEALWASLPPAVQARIGALAIEAETFQQLAEDGGFHTTFDDRETAQGWADDALNKLRPAIWAALPATLPTVYDEPYPLWQMLEGRADVPDEVDVRGLGLRPLVREGYQWLVRVDGRLVELGGAVCLNCRQDDAPRRWQFWTVADIDTERLRRHPEMTLREVAS